MKRKESSSMSEDEMMDDLSSLMDDVEQDSKVENNRIGIKAKGSSLKAPAGTEKSESPTPSWANEPETIDAKKSQEASNSDTPPPPKTIVGRVADVGFALRDVVALPFDIIRTPLVLAGRVANSLRGKDNSRADEKLKAIGGRMKNAVLTALAPAVTLATGIAAVGGVPGAKEAFKDSLPRLAAFTVVAATVLTGGIAAAGAGAIAATVASVPLIGPAIGAAAPAIATLIAPAVSAIAPVISAVSAGLSTAATMTLGAAGAITATTGVSTTVALGTMAAGATAIAAGVGVGVTARKITNGVTATARMMTSGVAVTPAMAEVANVKPVVAVPMDGKGTYASMPVGKVVSVSIAPQPNFSKLKSSSPVQTGAIIFPSAGGKSGKAAAREV
jgi:hypothetical protein